MPLRPHRKEIYVFFIPVHQLGRGFQFPALNNWGKPPDSTFSHLKPQTFSALVPSRPGRSSASPGANVHLICRICRFLWYMLFPWFANFQSWGSSPAYGGEATHHLSCRKALTFTQKTFGLRADKLELDMKSHTCLNHHLPRIFNLFNFQVVFLFRFFLNFHYLFLYFFNIISWGFFCVFFFLFFSLRCSKQCNS